MASRPRVLFDLRETRHLRGYHAAATLMLLARRRPLLEFHVARDVLTEEVLALYVIEFESASPLRGWDGQAISNYFDLYVLFAERLPRDPLVRASMQSARKTLLALTFGQPPELPDLILADGHDTTACAALIESTLLKAGAA